LEGVGCVKRSGMITDDQIKVRIRSELRDGMGGLDPLTLKQDLEPLKQAINAFGKVIFHSLGG
jgi:hypothetical protein